MRLSFSSGPMALTMQRFRQAPQKVQYSKGSVYGRDVTGIGRSVITLPKRPLTPFSVIRCLDKLKVPNQPGFSDEEGIYILRETGMLEGVCHLRHLYSYREHPEDRTFTMMMKNKFVMGAQHLGRAPRLFFSVTTSLKVTCVLHKP